MNSADYQRVIAELDALSSQTAELIQRFEATGFNVTMKDDYVSLHVLQHRILGMRLDYSRMIDNAIV